LFATQAISKGEFFAAIPTEAFFSRLSMISNPAILELTSTLYDDADLRNSDWAQDVQARCCHCFIPPPDSSSHCLIMQFLELSLLLLLESCYPTSVWAPWIRSLPQSVQNAATIPLHEIEAQIRSSFAKQAQLTTEEEEQLSKTITDTVDSVADYQAFLNQLCQSHPVVRHVLNSVAKQRCGGDSAQAKALFLWAVSLVTSRSFRGRLLTSSSSAADQPLGDEVQSHSDVGTHKRTQFLAPFCDMLNHPDGGDSANTSIYVLTPPSVEDFQANNSAVRRYLHALSQAGVDLTRYGLGSEPGQSVDPLEAFRCLRAECDIQPNQELFFQYGPAADPAASFEEQLSIRSQMLYDYGFIPASKPKDDAESLGGVVSQKYLRAASALLELRARTAARSKQSNPNVRVESFELAHDAVVQRPPRPTDGMSAERRKQIQVAASLGANLKYTSGRDKKQMQRASAIEAHQRAAKKNRDAKVSGSASKPL
jgi:hypothetical protein